MRYRRGEHPNSLANLRPIKPGQVLNPTGANQRQRERDAWRIANRLVDAIDVAPTEERRDELLEELTRHCVLAGVAGDPQVVVALLERLWPLE